MQDGRLFKGVREALNLMDEAAGGSTSSFYGYCVGSAMVARAHDDLDAGNYMDQLGEHHLGHCVHPGDRRMTHTELIDVGIKHLSVEQQARLLATIPPDIAEMLELVPKLRNYVMRQAYRAMSGDVEE